MPWGSPKPPVCTLFNGATTVAGAALPVLKTLVLTSSRGRFGWLVAVSILAASRKGVSSGALASIFSVLGWTTFCVTKMCGWRGFSLIGSTTSGLGCTTALGLILGGGGATGTSVSGCANCTMSMCKTVLILSG